MTKYVSIQSGINYTHAIACRNKTWLNLNLGVKIRLNDNLKFGLNYLPYFNRVITKELNFIRFNGKCLGLTLTQNF